MAAITDGTSNTLLITEVAHSRIVTAEGTTGAASYYNSLFGAWTFPGEMTIPTNAYPPNTPIVADAGTITSSRHPGGVNCTFADGSVHFIKSTINSWNGTPNGIGKDANNHPTLIAGFPVPVWQALSTKAGGEVIGSDQY